MKRHQKYSNQVKNIQKQIKTKFGTVQKNRTQRPNGVLQHLQYQKTHNSQQISE